MTRANSSYGTPWSWLLSTETMRKIKCQKCGAIIEATGAECFCPRCREEIKTSSSLRVRTCKSCGAEFLGGPRAWYCPECRRERQAAQHRESLARGRAGTTRKIGSTGICAICGKEYIVASGTQKYCPECAKDAVKEIDRQQAREYAAEHANEFRERKKQRAQGRRVCRVCGKSFYAPSPAVTCSPECAAIWRSYQMAQADVKRGREGREHDLEYFGQLHGRKELC